jgi:hypothetical protein
MLHGFFSLNSTSAAQLIRIYCDAIVTTSSPAATLGSVIAASCTDRRMTSMLCVLAGMHQPLDLSAGLEAILLLCRLHGQPLCLLLLLQVGTLSPVAVALSLPVGGLARPAAADTQQQQYVSMSGSFAETEATGRTARL